MTAVKHILKIKFSIYLLMHSRFLYENKNDVMKQQNLQSKLFFTQYTVQKRKSFVDQRFFPIPLYEVTVMDI